MPSNNFHFLFRLVLTFCIFIISYGKGDAQYFEKVYNNDSTKTGILFALTPDHGIVILGDAVDSITHRNGYNIIKIDSNGSILWEKNLIDRHDAYGYSITSLKNGNIVILGTHIEDSYPIVAEIVLLNSSGDSINSAIYPPFNGWGSAGIAVTNSDDSSVAFTLYNDGFISNNYYSVFSLNPDLSTRWSDFVGYDGSFTNAHGIISNGNGNIYTLSYYDDYFYSANPLSKVSSVRKHDNTGAVLLDSIYEFNCVTTSIESTDDGGAVILGSLDTLLQRDLILIRLDSSGNVLWKKQFGSSRDEEANSVIETKDHGFALLATISDSIIPGQHDLLLLKTNAAGDSLWSDVFGATLNENAKHIMEDNSDLVIMGSTNSFKDNLIYLIRTDSTGKVISPYSISPPGRYFCADDTVSLFINPSPPSNSHIAWSNGDTINPARVFSTGNYFATITDSTGKSFQTSFTPVYFSSRPDATFGSDTMRICSGTFLRNNSTELTNHYQWYLNGQILPNENLPYLKPEQTGTYELIVNNYCSADTAIALVDSIYNNPIEPVITTPSVNFVCKGDSLALSFVNKPGETYQWYLTDYINSFIISGETDSVLYVHDNGSYFVQVTNVNGCTSESVPQPVSYDLDKEFININGPQGFCKGGEVELSAPPGSDYLWSRGDTTQFITVDTTGDFFVTFINKNSCYKLTDTVSITVYDNPGIFLGPDTSLCDTSTIILDAGSGYINYLWNDASTNQTLLVTPGGIFPDSSNYFVFVIDSNGCTSSDTINVVFDICNGVFESKNKPAFFIPNPVSANESFRIISRIYGNYTFMLWDDLNRELIFKKFNEILYVNQSESLKPGIYLYRIEDESKFVTSGKLIVN